jgi:hypothetical protein
MFPDRLLLLEQPSYAFAQAEDKPLAETPATAAKPTLTEQLLHETVLLECANADGKIISTGTSFFFSFLNHGGTAIQALITNKHVVDGASEAFITLTMQKPDGTPDFGNNKRIKLSDVVVAWLPHPDQKTDLIAAIIGPGLQKLYDAGQHFMIATCDQSLIPTEEQLKALTPLEEVLVVGYPDGISDTTNNVPVFRRGVTATPISLNFKGEPFFLLDAAIFPGSSGSPVFLYNQGAWSDREGHFQLGSRAALIGIVFGVYNHTTDGRIIMLPAPTQLTPQVQSQIPNNLGVCIKAEKLLDFEPQLVKYGAKVPDGYVVRSSFSPR